MAFWSVACLALNYNVLFKSSRSGILVVDLTNVRGLSLGREKVCIEIIT